MAGDYGERCVIEAAGMRQSGLAKPSAARRATPPEHARLGDLVHIEHGWPFKSVECTFERGSGPVVVNIGNFRYTGGFRFQETSVREYVGGYPPKYELDPDDLLLAMTCQTADGSILGIPGRIPDDGVTYLHNQRLGKVVVDRPECVCVEYLYWVFLSRRFNRHLCSTASGT